MKLEMNFESAVAEKKFGINIFLDYCNEKYAWNAWIKYPYTAMKYYEYGLKFTPIEILKSNYTLSLPKTLVILSKEEFLNKLPELDSCVFYTGAGLSVAAGIWDLAQLRDYLFLNSIEKFEETVHNDKRYYINVCRNFAEQLYCTEPTYAHKVISQLQKRYRCYIFTENRDFLHQKAGGQIITRNDFARKQILLFKKNLVVVGMSKDHSGLIRKYRELSGGKPIYIIDKHTIPEYVRAGDYFVKGDAQEIFATIYKEYLNDNILL